MDLGINGKKGIVGGASAGLGKACAFALGLSSLVGMVEQRLEYYAGTR
ncbi:MAG: hypothetical protein V2I56_03575 [Desulfobacteraceae bacterium]|jgi:hypothetical protein|nr:hypothetical protein [Desulfobacteraceae bacterium]